MRIGSQKNWFWPFILCFPDVLVLNDIINQTAAAEPSSDVISRQPRNSLISAGSAAGGSNAGASAAGASINAGQTSTALALERARRESRKISMMLDEDEDEGPRLKEKLTEACQQFVDIFCVWDCCWVYIKLSEVSWYYKQRKACGCGCQLIL